MIIGGERGRDDAAARIQGALGRCGHKLQLRSQIVTLPQVGRGSDLAVALAILVAHGVVPAERLANVLIWGDLDVEGDVLSAPGLHVAVDAARQHDIPRVIVPAADARAAASLGVEVTAASTLAELVKHLQGKVPPPAWGPARNTEQPRSQPDMSDIRGLERAKLAIEVMVAGGHHLLMRGPIGVGKTMLARRVAGLLPDLDRATALEVTKIHGVAHRRAPDSLVTRPPVRMPHHTVSVAGLLGGGSHASPGEVSLAHGGVLFLDELPEFPRACIEGLREPLREGVATIVRHPGPVHYPARFQLLAATNSCPCGLTGRDDRRCECPPSSVTRYLDRIAPLLGRFDLVTDVEPASGDEYQAAESSAVIRERIVRARARQAVRWADAPWSLNAELPDSAVLDLEVTGEAASVLRMMNLGSGNANAAAARVLRIARTAQDLRDHGPISGDAIETAGMLANLV